MNVSLLILVGWLSATLAPLPSGKVPPSPELEQYRPQKLPSAEKFPSSKEPLLEEYQPIKPGKLPKVTRPAKANLKPGSYSAESLQLPAVVSMDSYDAWQQGPAWPYVENGLVIVTPNAADPQRFMAFLIDVNNQRIAAIRDGDTSRHFFLIGQLTAQSPGEKPGVNPQGQLPPTITVLAGSGAVIIIRPPVPPGPTGLPDDFAAALLDVATIVRRTMDMANVDQRLQPGQLNQPNQANQFDQVHQLNELNQAGKFNRPDKGGFH